MSGSFRYPRELRLRSRKDTDTVFRRGQYHRLGMLHAKTLRTDGEASRFLVSVKKKIGSAPERNRIRRLVREAVRLNRERLHTTHDICFFLTTRPTHPPRLESVTGEILKLFERLDRPTQGRKAR
jgi:ribonuclease P protein component